MATNNLLPCPFCGTMPDVVGAGWGGERVACANSDCWLNNKQTYPDTWNTRLKNEYTKRIYRVSGLYRLYDYEKVAKTDFSVSVVGTTVEEVLNFIMSKFRDARIMKIMEGEEVLNA